MSYPPNMQPDKTPSPAQDSAARAKNFAEVDLGYDAAAAENEAARCLQCKHKPCMAGCPVNVDIPGFIARLKEGDAAGAYEVLLRTNSLPAVCGRVCPQETQCEALCVRGIKGEPVAIGRLERYAADCGIKRDACDIEEADVGDIAGTSLAADEEKNPVAVPAAAAKGVSAASVSGSNAAGTATSSAPVPARVAVIGAGPAGLTCAGDLNLLGYDVTVFEAFHTAGGVLVYGIPEFRLPKAIVRREIDALRARGVKIETDMVAGRTVTVDELFEQGFQAIFIGTGAGLPVFLGIEGENLSGVLSANEFLTRVNLMKAYSEEYDTPVPKAARVAVVGGGNVAMDAARCALRLGAEVTVVYRRGEAEMPARREEIAHAKEEGIRFELLTAPVAVEGDDKGCVTGLRCVSMTLGEPDASGRRRPVEVPGSEHTLPADMVIAAIGTSPNPLLRRTTPGIEADKHGCLVVDGHMATTRKGVWAGGDTVTGAATVILAMGAGKKAAAAMDEWLKENGKA